MLVPLQSAHACVQHEARTTGDGDGLLGDTLVGLAALAALADFADAGLPFRFGMLGPSCYPGPGSALPRRRMAADGAPTRKS